MGTLYSLFEEPEQTIITSNRQYSYNSIQPQSLIQLNEYFNNNFNDKFNNDFNDNFNNISTNINTTTPDIETPESDDEMSPGDF